MLGTFTGDGAYSCGSGQNGRLGLGSQINASSFAPMEALDGICAFQISSGLDHSLILTEKR